MIRAHLKLLLAAWWPKAMLRGSRTLPAPGPSPGQAHRQSKLGLALVAVSRELLRRLVAQGPPGLQAQQGHHHQVCKAYNLDTIILLLPYPYPFPLS